MPRGTTARTVISLLAAALLTFQLFAPSASFATAHTSRDVVANDQSGTIPSGWVARIETVTCHDAGRPGDPTGPARVRDRHRTATAPEPRSAERPLLRQRIPAVFEQVQPGIGHSRPPRPSADRSPAALQVFRC
ncbi:hypothetical protein J7I94_27325 [Streptomyces sp. ISL-12]|nr:hypothetical protein [Streptomyces sp. ISL-12]